MIYKGTVVFIGETKAVSDKFVVRELVVTDNSEKYPQEVKFQVTQKNCPILDMYKVGEPIVLHFNLRGRRYEKNGKTDWFTTVEAWKFEQTGKIQVEEKNLLDAFDDVVPF